MSDPSDDGGIVVEVVSEVVGESAKALAVVIGADPIAAAATGGLASGTVKALDRLVRRRRQRLVTFVDTASEHSHFEQLVDLALADDRKFDLLRRALEAAYRTANEQRVRLYARLAAEGILAADNALVDQKDRVLTSLAALDPSDLKVLLHMHGQSDVVHWTKEESDRGPNLRAALPEAAPVLDAVLARLEFHGLVTGHVGSEFFSGPPTWVVTDFGHLCVRELMSHADDGRNSP